MRLLRWYRRRAWCRVRGHDWAPVHMDAAFCMRCHKVVVASRVEQDRAR